MYIYNASARMDFNKLIGEKRSGGSEEAISKALNYFMDEIKINDRILMGKCIIPSFCKPQEHKVRCDITWRVLDKKGSKLLLITEDCIDWEFFDGAAHIFGPVPDTSWGTSSIRQYLNGEIYDLCFTDSEKAVIVESAVETVPNFHYGSGSSEITLDKLFLLSVEDVDKYFAIDTWEPLEDRVDISGGWAYLDLGNDRAQAELKCIDKYLYAEDELILEKNPHNWWLRTAGESEKSVAIVCEDGCYIDIGGYTCDSEEVGVRPAMWIDIALV